MEKNIPEYINIGGVQIYVCDVPRCQDNNLGDCCVAEGRINIANLWDKDKQQCNGSKRQTFFHEVVHAILDTMGETELSKSEKFVCTFSSFLNEAMADAVFKTKE